jgi:hypothetical protein
MKLTRWIVCLPLALAACGQDEGPGYDEKLLAEYRAALPSEGRLSASGPRDVARAAGDAVYPNAVVDGVTGVNGMVQNIVVLLRAVVALPPSLFNSETQEFVWGPWDRDDGAYGQVLVYIRKNAGYPDTEDFQYSYAFVRRDSPDVASWASVIIGGATPHPTDPDLGAGVTLFDFTMNDAWEQAHDAAYDSTAAHTLGRFLAFYGAGTETDGRFAFNLAVFRDFSPADGSTGGVGVDLDYLYGRWTGNDSNTLTFLDWEATADFCSPGPACYDQNSGTSALDEVNGIRLAFFNDGQGRAESKLSGGDLGATVVDAVECWNGTVEQTHLSWTLDGGATYYYPDATGRPWFSQDAAVGCGSVFMRTLDNLNVPSIAKMRVENPGLIELMGCVAENGFGSSACGG